MLDASPALLKTLNRLVDLLDAKVVNSVDAPTPERERPKRVEKPKEPVEEPGAQDKDEPEAQDKDEPEAPEPTEEPKKPKYTLDQIRRIMADTQEGKDDKRAVMLAMKGIMQEMGATSISALPEDKYEEFVEKVTAL